MLIMPQHLKEVVDAVAASSGLEICGGGSKQGMWSRTADLPTLDMRGMSGIVDYDPDELIVTVRSGTPLRELRQVLAARNQMLAFEPYDHGPIFGQTVECATIGGIVASNVSGSRRLLAGAARDHVLGFEGVSGRGEAFRGGGKVVKNVTGYDLPKLMAGSWGTLAILTEITLRALPAPKAETTLLLAGLSEAKSIAAMGQALSLPASVSGAAKLGEVTALRIEGFAPSVAARVEALRSALSAFGDWTAIDGDESHAWWTRFASFDWLAGVTGELWRVSVPPTSGARAAEAIGGRRTLDWGGGLIWVEDPQTQDVRAIAKACHGYAQCVRSPHPLDPLTVSGELAVLNARVKEAFDPLNRLNPGIGFARGQ